MSNTIESLLDPGIQKAINSAAIHLNEKTRDELLGPSLASFVKSGNGAPLVLMAFYADGLRVVFDALLADGKITAKEVEVSKSFLAKVAASFAKVRKQYKVFESFTVAEVIPFLKLYRSDTGALGHLNASTKWSGIAVCQNIAKKTGDSAALNTLRETLLKGAKALLMADGMDQKEEFYLKKLEEELHGKISAPKPVQNTSGIDSALAAIIQGDFKALEASSDSDEWIKNNCTRITSWQKAAELNDPRGQVLLGLCLYFGHGIKKNLNEAFKWYRKASEKKLARAQYNLGVCYANGNGVKADQKEAVKWYRMAAEQGFAKAQYNLGSCYYHGEGVKEDKTEAVKWYRKAAEQGDANAQYNLGVCYYIGQGVQEDKKEAVKWYRMAAEQGDVDAQSCLGVCYDEGKGVRMDKKEAVKWYRMAAEQGNALAQVNLGECYSDGKGVEEDKYQAFKWYELAADQGYALGQLLLGVCFANGEGTARDTKEAFKWYQLAADQGNARGQYILGVCYADGQGIDEDMDEAIKWYRKAAKQGIEEALNALEELEEDDDFDSDSDSDFDFDSYERQKDKEIKAKEGVKSYEDWTRLTDSPEDLALAQKLIEEEKDGLLFVSLLELSVEAAEILATSSGNLTFLSVRDWSLPVVQALAKHEGGLSLSSLNKMTDEIAEALSHHHGSLELHSLSSISDKTALYLSRHRGGLILGLKTISVKGAMALVKIPDELLLINQVFSEEILKILFQKDTIRITHSKKSDSDYEEDLNDDSDYEEDLNSDYDSDSDSDSDSDYMDDDSDHKVKDGSDESSSGYDFEEVLKIFSKINSGVKVLDPNECDLLDKYFSDCNVETLEVDITNLPDQVAKLLSSWTPDIGENSPTLYIPIKSLTDSAAKIISKWHGWQPRFQGSGYVSFPDLENLSETAGSFLLNAAFYIRINPKLLPPKILKILKKREIEEDWGDDMTLCPL